MINTTKKEKSNEANAIIETEMRSRIPFYRQISTDDSPCCIYQSDLFGYTDTIIQLASDRLYHNQNKSRSDGRTDICIECRSFRGNPQNLATGESSPIAGAHWCEAWKRWLMPRFNQIDTITYYLPKAQFVGHYSRYYLEIMLSKPEAWSHVNCIFQKNTDMETYLIFIDYRVFNTLYLKTVSDVTCGVPVTIGPEEIALIQEELE